MARAKIVTDPEGRYVGIHFMCEGCKRPHLIPTKWTPPGMARAERPAYISATWEFDGNLDLPTLQPSVKYATGHYCDGEQQPPNCWLCNEYPNKSPCSLCHTYVTAGVIEFLNDCTHPLRGRHALPEIDAPHKIRLDDLLRDAGLE